MGWVRATDILGDNLNVVFVVKGIRRGAGPTRGVDDVWFAVRVDV